MSKLPALQFYPGDWHRDPGVQALNLMERGAWIEILFMMHDSEDRGVLLLNGVPMPEEVLALRLHLDNQTANQIVSKLLAYGVASRRQNDGALFSRRMVRDEHVRQIRTAAGKKGGNPSLVKQNNDLLNQTANQKSTTGVNQNPTPSSSSSSSSSKKKEEYPSGSVPPPVAAPAKIATAEPKPKADAAIPETAHHQSIAVFCELWKNRYGQKYPFNAGKDGTSIKLILKHLGGDLDQFKLIARRYFDTDDPFVLQARHTLALLQSQLAKWLVDPTKKVGPKPRPRSAREADEEFTAQMFTDAFGGSEP